MNGVPKDSGSAKKMKKPPENTQVSATREYLDMDTDDEEFGRQETPEPEEELELEPEKPVFTAEQLNSLVQCVKDLTTLSSMTQNDWSGDVVEVVEEYFKNPAETILTLFRRDEKLKAILEFPILNDDESLFYFLRTPWQIYTPENFSSNVICGSVDGIDRSVLSFVENIYAPVAFHSDEWPMVVRNEIFSNLNEFITRLIDVNYKPMGLTVFYVPREGLTDDEEFPMIRNDEISSKNIETLGHRRDECRNENEKCLMERLERVARYWIKQIGEAIRGTCTTCDTSSTWKTIDDEIRFWHYRHENLSCVNRQLTCVSIVGIVERLKSARSASVDRYDSLITEISENLKEAASNIKYLNLFREFNQYVKIPDEVDDYATKTLLLIRFVGLESPFYNTDEKMENLCRAFCVEAANNFRESIDLTIILDGDARIGKIMLVKCIDSCNELNKVYDRLKHMDENESSPTISRTDKSKVFNYVDTLVHRCNDLVAIADARIAFEKSDEPIRICGPKGFDLSSRYRDIEKLFDSSLTMIKNIRDIILDIVSSAWLDHVVDFKRRLKNLENMVKNWIDDVFNDIVNVEDGIEALHGIARLSQRPYLRQTLNNKWIKIWKIFVDELDTRSAVTKQCSVLCERQLPNYSVRANIIRTNKIHLEKQYKMLIDASDWFDDCDAQPTVTQKYKSVLAAMTEMENSLFFEWQKYIAEEKINIAVVSNEPIMKYHEENGKPRTIVTNLQIFHINCVREIGEWTVLDYDPKNIFSKNCPNWETLQLRYNKVEYICKMYNDIVTNVADHEGSSFSTMVNDLDEVLNAGFEKTTWSSDSFEIYFKECLEIFNRVKINCGE